MDGAATAAVAADSGPTSPIRSKGPLAPDGTGGGVASQAPTRPAAPTASAIHGDAHVRIDVHSSRPAQNAAAAAGAIQPLTGSPRPQAHTVTKSRISSRVEGPMPLTSSS